MDIKAQTKLLADSRYHNSLFEVIVLFVVVVLVGAFVVRPKYNSNQMKADELQKAKAQYEKVETDRAAMEKLLDKMDESEQDIALVDQALPLNGRITALNLLIDNLAVSSGMQLASISTEDMSSNVVAGDEELIDDPFGANRKLQVINATVTVTGPVEQFRQFLKLIEKSPRLMDIDTIAISNQEDEVLYKVRLKAYFYAPEYEKPKAQDITAAQETQ